MGGSSNSACSNFNYTPGIHPGIVFLPPADILTYPSLPSSVLGQISHGGDYYDYYGKFSAAYDSDTMIDAPSGKAKKDYEEWLKREGQIASEIDAKVQDNYESRCGTEEQQLMASV